MTILAHAFSTDTAALVVWQTVKKTVAIIQTRYHKYINKLLGALTIKVFSDTTNDTEVVLSSS